MLLVSFSLGSKEAQAFREALRDARYAEGRDVVIHWHWASGGYHLVPEAAVAQVQSKADVIVSDSTFGTRARRTLVRLAARSRVPTTYSYRVYGDEGGLMSYGPSFANMFRRSAGYVDSILRGARPGHLPIAQPTKFELIVKMNTAKSLGLAIPQSILPRADEVIP
jgi:putative ABC transport system substrate-binding protein